MCRCVVSFLHELWKIFENWDGPGQTVEVLLTTQNGQIQLCLQKFRQIVPKSKICYISPLRIYKKIFFSGHFNKIFISKVDFCKFWLVWELRNKVHIFALRTPKKKFSYIFVKGLYKKIFLSGHFDEIFISKVDFCKFLLVWGLRKKLAFSIWEPRNEKFLIY